MHHPVGLENFRTSNDNPYSEAQFKTMKYVPDFPERFGPLEDARKFCDGFFLAYNYEHRHSGIGMHTPASVHFGTAEQIQAQRQATLDRAHAAYPHRFTRRQRQPIPQTARVSGIGYGVQCLPQALDTTPQRLDSEGGLIQRGRDRGG